jgi:hypothetical protein
LIKTYRAILLKDWPRLAEVIKRWQASNLIYGKGTWAWLFKTKRYHRHNLHRRYLELHMDWMIHHYIGNYDWQYRGRDKIFVLWRKDNDQHH